MIKKLLTFIVICLLVSDSEAGRSFSGGRSSSFSSSRSFSSGRSFSGSSGRSFSGGSSRSYSGGKSFSGSSSGGTSSGRSFSGGRSSSSSSSRTTYSGGSSTTSVRTSGSSYSAKPSKSSFDSLGTRQQMKVESRVLYNRGQSPRTEYRTSSGRTASISSNDARVERLRGQLDQQKWVNREMRQQQFYGGYYSRPVVAFHDPYPSFFWWWLLDRSLNDRAMWAYCHKSDMDPARYQALLSKDAQLDARIKQLEKQGVKADNTYVPPGMDQDLMYSNEYVDAAYNPESKTNWTVVKIVLWSFAIGGILWFLIWFVFFRET